MKTLSYIYGHEEEIEIGQEYYFGQLWDGVGDGQELLQSGAISPDNENIVAFDIVKKNEDILETLVKVTDAPKEKSVIQSLKKYQKEINAHPKDNNLENQRPLPREER